MPAPHRMAFRFASRLAAPPLLGLGLWVASTCPSTAQAQSTPEPSARQPQAPPLQPGDRIRLHIWREADLSKEALDVDERGMVTFPKIGILKVTDMSADSLKLLLISRYSASLREPSIEVTLQRRARILGAVRNPGVYYLDPTMTVGDAIALAGGIASDGKQNVLELRRAGSTVKLEFTEETRIADTPIRSGDHLFVPERSWASRNMAVILGGSLTAAAIIITALIKP